MNQNKNFLKLGNKFKALSWMRADQEYFNLNGERLVSTEYGYIDLVHFFTLYQIPNPEGKGQRWVLSSLLTGFANKTYVKNLTEGKRLARVQLGIFFSKFCRTKILRPKNPVGSKRKRRKRKKVT